MRQLSDMVCNKTPLFLAENASVEEACRGMNHRKAGSVLVVDDAGKLTGIFTGRDAVRRVLAAGKNCHTRLAEVMTRNPITLSPEKTALDAMRIMWDGGFRHLPLVDRDKVMGVISHGDFQNEERLQLDEERQLWEHMR